MNRRTKHQRYKRGQVTSTAVRLAISAGALMSTLLTSDGYVHEQLINIGTSVGLIIATYMVIQPLIRHLDQPSLQTYCQPSAECIHCQKSPKGDGKEATAGRIWPYVGLPQEVSTTPPDVDVVVVTALAQEQAAMVAALGESNIAIVRQAGRDIHVAALGHLRVAVVPLHGMGNVAAAATTSEVIDIWRPRHLLLTGIAAGIRRSSGDLSLGDVLVADQVVGFELAKITANGPQRRYECYRPHFDLLTAASSVTTDEWAPTITELRPDGQGTAGVHVGTVLSGEKVFADVTSVQELCRAWPKAIGVEMEGLGVALAAHRGGGGFLLVKGVSDFADAAKSDLWHRYAANAAAKFAVAVLRRLTPTRPSLPRSTSNRSTCAASAYRNPEHPVENGQTLALPVNPDAASD